LFKVFNGSQEETKFSPLYNTQGTIDEKSTKINVLSCSGLVSSAHGSRKWQLHIISRVHGVILAEEMPNV
jgi:hypothetical protein